MDTNLQHGNRPPGGAGILPAVGGTATFPLLPCITTMPFTSSLSDLGIVGCKPTASGQNALAGVDFRIAATSLTGC